MVSHTYYPQKWYVEKSLVLASAGWRDDSNCSKNKTGPFIVRMTY